MKHPVFIFQALMVFALFVLVPQAVNAGTGLDAKNVESFINSMGDVEKLAGDMKAEGKDEFFSKETIQGMEKFAPYSNSLPVLKEKYGDDYKKLGGIVKQHGFSSQDDWAGVGDQVMLSYIALKTQETNPNYKQMASQMSPEMVAQMPSEVQAQMKKMMIMVKAIESVPETNMALVKPHMSRIDEWTKPKE